MSDSRKLRQAREIYKPDFAIVLQNKLVRALSANFKSKKRFIMLQLLKEGVM